MRSPESRTPRHVTSRRAFLCTALASGGLAAAGLSSPRVGWAQQAPAAKGGETPKKGGTLRVGFYVEAATMDPHLSGSKIDRQVYHNIYEPLLVLDTNLGIKPGLAESWQQPDPKTLILKLRRGVKFHDGTDFDAEAVKFNFNRMKNEPKSVRKGEVASIDTVDVVDSHTVKLNLKRPDAALAHEVAVAAQAHQHDGDEAEHRRAANRSPPVRARQRHGGPGRPRVERRLRCHGTSPGRVALPHSMTRAFPIQGRFSSVPEVLAAAFGGGPGYTRATFAGRTRCQ